MTVEMISGEKSQAGQDPNEMSQSPTWKTQHVEDGVSEGPSLSAEHREYLLARHGTLDLHPLPSTDPSDPLNWPWWKVR